MADEEYKKVFSKNLRYYMDLNGKNQMDLMNDLHLSSSTVSNWCTGLKLPRMDKVQKLADYFHINKSDLIEEKDDSKEPELTARDEKDIAKILEQTKEQLLSEEGLMFDGDPASPEAINSILDAMQIGMEMAKKKNKEKYTPKKYKKD